MMGYPDDGSYSIATANQAFEIGIRWDALGNPRPIYQVDSAAHDCSSGEPCLTYDQGPCFAEAGDSRQQ